MPLLLCLQWWHNAPEHSLNPKHHGKQHWKRPQGAGEESEEATVCGYDVRCRIQGSFRRQRKQGGTCWPAQPAASKAQTSGRNHICHHWDPRADSINQRRPLRPQMQGRGRNDIHCWNAERKSGVFL